MKRSFADDDMEIIGEIDIFSDSRGTSKEEQQRRKARFDALENIRSQNSLRKQIDYLYDKNFTNLNPESPKKRR